MSELIITNNVKLLRKNNKQYNFESPAFILILCVTQEFFQAEKIANGVKPDKLGYPQKN